MNRTLFTLLVAILATFSLRAEDNAKPDIVFVETSHEFGNINEADGPVTCYFDFTNEGDAPLVIISATAQCGCTTPDYPRRPVEAGQSGQIKVTYSPKGRPGEFTKVVTVKTNDKKNRTVKLKISGVVIPGKKK